MKEYSLSDIRDKSATVIIAYTIRAMNNCGFSKMQVDHYIKMIKDLSYNELVDLSNSILSTCNDYINDLYNDTNEWYNMKRTLEQRVARLERLIKNESKDSLYAAIDEFLDEQNCDEYGLMSIANYDDKEYFDDLRKYLIRHGFSTEYISKEWDDIEQTMMMAADNRILTGNYDKGYIEW